MNRDKQLWKMICLITVLSVFFVVMTEARPNRVSIPLVRREHVHVLTEGKHVPDLEFFWKMGRKVIRYNRDLSDEQKTRIKEEFWNLFIHTIAVQEDALSKYSGVSDKEDSALQRETFASAQHLEYIFAEYLRAIHDIFTPEQQNKHHKHHARARRFGRFQVVAALWTLAPTPGVPTVKKCAQIHAHRVEETTGDTHQFAWATLAQVSPQSPLHHDLHQLQILRL
jgi:hypothetical protein